jgi:hypothetical protein
LQEVVVVAMVSPLLQLVRQQELVAELVATYQEALILILVLLTL